MDALGAPIIARCRTNGLRFVLQDPDPDVHGKGVGDDSQNKSGSGARITLAWIDACYSTQVSIHRNRPERIPRRRRPRIVMPPSPRCTRASSQPPPRLSSSSAGTETLVSAYSTIPSRTPCIRAPSLSSRPSRPCRAELPSSLQS